MAVEKLPYHPTLDIRQGKPTKKSLRAALRGFEVRNWHLSAITGEIAVVFTDNNSIQPFLEHLRNHPIWKTRFEHRAADRSQLLTGSIRFL